MRHNCKRLLSKAREVFAGMIISLFPVACQVESSMEVPGGSYEVNAQIRCSSDTKADLINAVPDTFTLFASIYNGSAPTDISYIYGETMTRDGTKWVSANKFARVSPERTVLYWGLYPSDATGMTLPASTTSGMPKFTYLTPASATEGKDIIIGANSYSGSREEISLTMDHTLSAVDFRFSAEGAFNGTVKTITVSNVKRQGEYTLGSGWSNLSVVGDVSQTLNIAVTELMGGESVTTSSNAIVLIPQTAGGDAVLEMVVNDGTKDITLECSLAGQSFDAGKEYTIALDLSALTNAELIIESIDMTAWVTDATKYTLSKVMEYTETIPSGEFEFPEMTLSQGLEVVIDWGDGTIEKLMAGGKFTPVHTYATDGERTVKFYARGGIMTFSDKVDDLTENPYTVYNSAICQATITERVNQVIEVTSTSVINVPDDAQYFDLFMVNGGNGGVGANYTTQFGIGGLTYHIESLSLDESKQMSITIGAGGSNGGTGGQTSVTYNGITYTPGIQPSNGTYCFSPAQDGIAAPSWVGSGDLFGASGGYWVSEDTKHQTGGQTGGGSVGLGDYWATSGTFYGAGGGGLSLARYNTSGYQGIAYIHFYSSRKLPDEKVYEFPYEGTYQLPINEEYKYIDLFMVNGGNGGSGIVVNSYFGIGGLTKTVESIDAHGGVMVLTIGTGGISGGKGGQTSVSYNEVIYSPGVQPDAGAVGFNDGQDGVAAPEWVGSSDLFGACGSSSYRGGPDTGGKTGGGYGYSYKNGTETVYSLTNGSFYGAGGGGNALADGAMSNGYRGIVYVRLRKN